MHSDGFYPIVFTISPPPLTSLVHSKDLARVALSPALSNTPKGQPVHCHAHGGEGREEEKQEEGEESHTPINMCT